MKATLEFNLPEEELQFKATSQALDWQFVVSELAADLRSRLKYNSDNYTPEALSAISEIHELLHSLCKDNNLDIP